MDYFIIKIETKDNTVEDRQVLVTINNGTQITIESCYESWQQFGGTEKELWTTTGIADLFNDWLHGEGNEPDECDYHDELVSVAKDWLKENVSEWCKDVDCIYGRFANALDIIGKDRCTLQHADYNLYLDMQDALETWCADNDYDVEEFDIEDLVI